MNSVTHRARASDASFEGEHYCGRGDVEFLQLLDISRRMFGPDPQYQNLSMLYEPKWNGFVEGPTWDAWWIQNSYGTTYCALPFLEEPMVTFLQNAQDLWFDQMGDGKRVGVHDWVAPDGCLCDAARPGWIVYKQGDCRIDIHDWALEFTAAGIVLQGELLLIGRDTEAVARYLPKLQRSADFIESRRDPSNNLFLAGPAANLLAPSYAGWRKPDGTYGQAYLAGLSVNYVAALDRLIELEKLVGRQDMVASLSRRREAAREGLMRYVTEEGYLVRSIDPDGVKHGVYGAAKHGYLETSPNHDAVAFRVVDDQQASRIYQKIVSIPQLRPHDFILPNYPSYDDIYDKPEGLWAYGTWVNGGHWSTCEARMILGYYRVGMYDDVRRSMKQLLTFARRFRMDNPLTKCGSDVYQPNEPVNLCYDSFGPPAALMRGLFEYLYRADSLTLIPHIPPGVMQLEQLDPVRFGKKRVYVTVAGTGPVTAVQVNSRPWDAFTSQAVTLAYGKLPDKVLLDICLGGAPPAQRLAGRDRSTSGAVDPGVANTRSDDTSMTLLRKHERRLTKFQQLLNTERLGTHDPGTLAARHAQLALAAIHVIPQRRQMLEAGKLPIPPEPTRSAADRSYLESALRLCDGLERMISARSKDDDPAWRKLAGLWADSLTE